MSSFPQHVNPPKESAALAPFNFVLLPQAILEVKNLKELHVTVADKQVGLWECHDRFVHDTHSGWIDISIEALTPIFIRGAARFRNGKWDDTKDTRLRSEPFLDHEGRPIIPGSSLRGEVLALVEILSFSKIKPVSRKKPFFRSMTPGRISDAYRSRFVEDLGKLSSGTEISTLASASNSAVGYQACVRAGLVRIRGTQRTIEECGFARIQRSELQKIFSVTTTHIGNAQNKIPNPKLQHRTVYVTADKSPQSYFFHQQVNDYGKIRHPDLYLRFRRVKTVSATKAAGFDEGVVVISGDMKFKHLEFVFLTGESLGTIDIPDKRWERFHDDDQITPWQEDAFPKSAARSRKGHLRDGEPVFFLCDPNKVNADNPQGLVFFGRAQMFRFPYDKTPASLVPAHLRDAGLDLAEVMFGRVPQSRDDGKAIKGRVFFEDCVVTEPGNWRADELIPQNLASPKVTAYQEYLTQDGRSNARNHTTYIDGDKTTIRGHKLYWHRWDDAQSLNQIKHSDNDSKLRELNNGRVNDTQVTVIQPVATHNETGTLTKFVGRIRFENLSNMELGALLSALNLPADCAHKIGMGKPLGLGSIRIEAKLNVINRATRYSSWEDSGATDSEPSTSYMDAFAAAIQQHAMFSKEAVIPTKPGLRQIARLDVLFHLLNWIQRPKPEQTRYLGLQEFRTRPVLPTPHGVQGDQSEPRVSDDRVPEPGPVSVVDDERIVARATSAPPRADESPPPPRGKTGTERATAHFIKLHPKTAGVGKVKLETGEVIDCTGIGAGLQLKANDPIQIDVQFDNGVPTQSKFKRKG